MFATSHCRPLPEFIPPFYSTRYETIGWTSFRLGQLYRVLLARDRVLNAPSPLARQALLLNSTLERADAEMRFAGEAKTLLNIGKMAQRIIDQAEIDFDFEVHAPAGLSCEELDQLPYMLGADQPASKWEHVNEARCLLDSIYLDDALGTDEAINDKIDVALLWASLPRVEDEIEFCGTRSTLDRIFEVAHSIAGRFPGVIPMAA